MSLRQRLLLLVLGIVALVWGGMAMFIYFDTRQGLDDELEQYSEQVESVYRHHRHDEDGDEGYGAELMDVRHGMAGKITLMLLLPLLLTLPVLAGLLWWVIAASLRPLGKLTQAISSRNPDNIAPLDVAAPSEVTPLIERLNHLFARTGKLIENERRFTADAAHELRTPIAAIKAQLQVAKGSQDVTEHRRALDNAIQGCNHATHLIEQLLTLARLESADLSGLQDCSLPALAVEVIADMAPAALEKDVSLELLDSENIAVKGLPALLQVMLRNLLDNAVRHTPPGTRVEVSIGRQDGEVFLQVLDDGIGLSVEEREKISRRFYRVLGTTGNGSGLGLSIVQRIAGIHHARLQVDAGRDGQGLSFLVVFPHQP